MICIWTPLNSLNTFQHFLFSHLILALVYTIVFHLRVFAHSVSSIFCPPPLSDTCLFIFSVSVQVSSLWKFPWFNQSVSIIPFHRATAVSYFYYGPYNTILHYLPHLQNYMSYSNSKTMFYFTTKYSSDPQRNWLLILFWMLYILSLNLTIQWEMHHNFYSADEET